MDDRKKKGAKGNERKEIWQMKSEGGNNEEYNDKTEYRAKVVGGEVHRKDGNRDQARKTRIFNDLLQIRTGKNAQMAVAGRAPTQASDEQAPW